MISFCFVARATPKTTEKKKRFFSNIKYEELDDKSTTEQAEEGKNVEIQQENNRAREKEWKKAKRNEKKNH